MSHQVIAAIIAASVSVVTAAVTVGFQISARRATGKDTEKAFKQQRAQLNTTLTEQGRQLDKTLAEQRTRTLNERFATAAGRLGSDKSAVRLAGMYAMAGLADDWSENRQTCVDVLCAYCACRSPRRRQPASQNRRPQGVASTGGSSPAGPGR